LSLKKTNFLLICFATLVAGCRATPPGKVETYAVTRAKRWLLVPNSRQANPLAATAANIDFGRASYSRYCNACHGLDGAGNGVAFATRMSPPAPSLASAPVQAYSDSQLKWNRRERTLAFRHARIERPPHGSADLVNRSVYAPFDSGRRHCVHISRECGTAALGDLPGIEVLRKLPCGDL